MPSGLAIGAGLATGFDNAARNFMAAHKAAEDAKIQKQKNEIEFKKGELEIKKLELDTDPAAVAAKRELLTYQKKAAQSLDDLRIAQIESEKTKLKTTLDQHKMAMDFFGPVLAAAQKDPSMMNALTFDTSGKIGYTPQKFANIPADIYTQMVKTAGENANTSAKKRTWWGAGRPTEEETNLEMQKLIKAYRQSNQGPGFPAVTAAAPEAPASPTAPEAGAETALPDPNTYEEGTVIQTDSGSQHKLVNGAWEPVEA